MFFPPGSNEFGVHTVIYIHFYKEVLLYFLRNVENLLNSCPHLTLVTDNNYLITVGALHVRKLDVKLCVLEVFAMVPRPGPMMLW